MGRKTLRSSEIWELAGRQHGVVTRAQLVARGLNDDGIDHRCSTGRLYRVRRGIYLVGRQGLTRSGELMAAVLVCGDAAVLSHRAAGELYGILDERAEPIDVTIPAEARRHAPGVRIHHRDLSPHERAERDNIPLTAPPCTLVDLAKVLTTRELEAAVNRADKLDRVHPHALEAAVRKMPPRAGKPALLRLLNRDTFTLTDSELERRFMVIASAAGLPVPLTQQYVLGYRVDFFWPDIALVVETDGLRYHRTAAAQRRDRERDQTLTANGLTVLRFTHAQVRYDPPRVKSTLAKTARRLRPR
jgi:very-short-patch-repair endonuclease